MQLSFQRNKEQSNRDLNSYKTKDEGSPPVCFSSRSPLALRNASSSLCATQGGVRWPFPSFCPTRALSETRMLGYDAGASPLSRANSLVRPDVFRWVQLLSPMCRAILLRVKPIEQPPSSSSSPGVELAVSRYQYTSLQVLSTTATCLDVLCWSIKPMLAQLMAHRPCPKVPSELEHGGTALLHLCL